VVSLDGGGGYLRILVLGYLNACMAGGSDRLQTGKELKRTWLLKT